MHVFLYLLLSCWFVIVPFIQVNKSVKTSIGNYKGAYWNPDETFYLGQENTTVVRGSDFSIHFKILSNREKIKVISYKLYVHIISIFRYEWGFVPGIHRSESKYIFFIKIPFFSQGVFSVYFLLKSLSFPSST